MDATTPTPPSYQPQGGYVPSQGGSKAGWWIAGILVFLLLASLGGCVAVFAAIGSKSGSSTSLTNRGVALIHLDGTIQDGGANATGSDPERIIRLLRKADADDSIKAILLRINSPGGTVSASQEIAMQVARTKKPVIADIGDVGASGAYYVASQSDEVVATPSSAVGSIGVILQAPNIEELMKKIGVKVTVLHEGKYKDIGSPYRSMTPSEAAIIQQDLKPAYEAFIADVAKGRKMPEAKVRELATGLVWGGTEAKRLGLVDSLGNYADAVEIAAKRGGISGTPDVVDYDQTDVFGSLSRLVGAVERLAAPSASAEVLKESVPR